MGYVFVIRIRYSYLKKNSGIFSSTLLWFVFGIILVREQKEGGAYPTFGDLGRLATSDTVSGRSPVARRASLRRPSTDPPG